jgi:hypothetical protein
MNQTTSQTVLMSSVMITYDIIRKCVIMGNINYDLMKQVFFPIFSHSYNFTQNLVKVPTARVQTWLIL